jgi:hypothetical protein
MRRLVGFTFLSLALLGKLLFSSGGDVAPHSSEIDVVQQTPIKNVAHAGINSSESVDAWIREEFYLGRFIIKWSANEITDGVNAGKIRVSANMTSNSVQKLEQSIVLRFNLDPRTESVSFAGMVLEGDEIIAPSGKPYSLDGAVAEMWDRRKKTYLDASDSE